MGTKKKIPHLESVPWIKLCPMKAHYFYIHHGLGAWNVAVVEGQAGEKQQGEGKVSRS